MHQDNQRLQDKQQSEEELSSEEIKPQLQQIEMEENEDECIEQDNPDQLSEIKPPLLLINKNKFAEDLDISQDYQMTNTKRNYLLFFLLFLSMGIVVFCFALFFLKKVNEKEENKVLGIIFIVIAAFAILIAFCFLVKRNQLGKFKTEKAKMLKEFSQA